MRRWLERYCPIAVLALTLQALAPIIALAPLAAAPFDPLRHAALCADLALTGNGDGPVYPGEASGGCCVLCAPLVGGPAVLDSPAPAAMLSPQRRFHRLVWHSAAAPPPAHRLHLNALARAPPAMT